MGFLVSLIKEFEGIRKEVGEQFYKKLKKITKITKPNKPAPPPLGRQETAGDKERKPRSLGYPYGHSVHGSRQPYGGKRRFRMRKPKVSEKA